MSDPSEAEVKPVVMPKFQDLKLLVGQKALVTGANSGIGRAIAGPTSSSTTSSAMPRRRRSSTRSRLRV